MSNYASLKATINANIRTNGNEEITGTILNSVLIQMVTSLGAGYQFMGLATPSTNPGTPDHNVAYLAGTGTYLNFDGISIFGLAILKYNGTWTAERIETVAGSEQMALNLGAMISGTDIIVNDDGYNRIGITITPQNVWQVAQAEGNFYSVFIPLNIGKYRLSAVDGLCVYAVLNSNSWTAGARPDFATGFGSRYSLSAGNEVIINIDSPKYLWVRADVSPHIAAVIPQITFLGSENRLLTGGDVVDNLVSTDPQMPLSARQGSILDSKRILADRIFSSGMVETVGQRITAHVVYVANADFRAPLYPPVGYRVRKIYIEGNQEREVTIGIYTPGIGIYGTFQMQMVNGVATKDVDLDIPAGSYICVGNAAGIIYRGASYSRYGSINITSGTQSGVDIAIWFEAEKGGLPMMYGWEHLIQIFPKLTTVGDSLMAGYMKRDAITVNSAQARAAGNNWPTYLAKRNGLEVHNLAIGSSTAGNWRFADGPSSDNLADINDANIPTDCYLFGVGVNDLRQSLAVGTDADIAASPDDNADSFYGNYDNIVRRCLAFNPKSHIFAFGIPNSESGNTAYNAAIQAIAQRYANVHYIDLTQAGAYQGAIISGCFANSHYNPLAYNLMSTIIELLINKYMMDNYTEFLVAPY